MTREDYLIVTGDFGCCFYGFPEDIKDPEWYEMLKKEGYLNYDRSIQEFWEGQKWTTLFVDGNHENFNKLNGYPVTEWHGGKVHMIKPNVIHLMRGQIFEIDGNTFFTMGGAESTDKWRRMEGYTWWRQEIPSYSELDEGIRNLEEHDMQVDYVITHCCPEETVRRENQRMMPYAMIGNTLTQYFEHLINDWGLSFKHWYYGHYHIDANHNKFHSLYNAIRPLDRALTLENRGLE